MVGEGDIAGDDVFIFEELFFGVLSLAYSGAGSQYPRIPVNTGK
jgi:hypothetical protein